MIAPWPYGQSRPLVHPLEAIMRAARFREFEVPVLFAGRTVQSGELPWTYIPGYFAVSLPDFYLLSFVAGILALPFVLRRALNRRDVWSETAVKIAFLIFAVIFPVATAVIMGSTLYDGIRHVLGIWVTANEGAKFWAGVCAELANRGVKDILIVCTDGLTGFAEAVEATWPQATVQTCVVHLIRNSMRFVSYGKRKQVAAALKSVYTAPTADAAAEAFEEFANSALGQSNPTTVIAWRNAWERFIPFLAFPPDLRRIIYTTNAIESLNYQLRKIIKNRGHFPSDQAAVKLLWLAICNIEDKRARERAKEKGKPASERKASGRLVEGQVVTNWKQALAQLAIAYPDRINPHL